MTSRNILSMAAIGLLAVFGTGIAQAGEEHCKPGNKLEIVTGEWVSGMHGDGVNWGDDRQGHAMTTVEGPVRHLRAWMDKDHKFIVALGVNDVIVEGKDQSVDQLHPDINLTVGPAGFVLITSEHGGHPDLQGIRLER